MRRKPKGINYRNRIFTRLCTEAGIGDAGITPHGLCDTSADLLARLGESAAPVALLATMEGK